MQQKKWNIACSIPAMEGGLRRSSRKRTRWGPDSEEGLVKEDVLPVNSGEPVLQPAPEAKQESPAPSRKKPRKSRWKTDDAGSVADTSVTQSGDPGQLNAVRYDATPGCLAHESMTVSSCLDCINTLQAPASVPADMPEGSAQASTAPGEFYAYCSFTINS